MTLLDIKGLSLNIGAKPILRNISLSLAPGEILGLVGESGSGKSLTLLSMMRLLPAAAQLSGSIRLDGADILTKSEAEMCALRGRTIGMVFQEPMTALNPVMTIGDQVAEVFRIHDGASRMEASQRAAETLIRVGLAPDRAPPGLYPHQLSGGQRQRVGIAMAIALKPRLLIADEPTTALDVLTQAQILDLFRKLVREDGLSLIIVSHDLGVVANLADRVAVMTGGEVVEILRVGELARAVHPYTRGLLAAAMDRPLRTSPVRSADDPLLRVRDAVCTYRLTRTLPFAPPETRRAVDGVSLAIAPGECVALIGESGCGKSTLARALVGLEPLRSGDVQVEGMDMTGARGAAVRHLRQTVQLVFQDPYGSFNPRHRVERIVAEPLHLLPTRLLPPERRARVEAALLRVGLSASDAKKFPHAFSGGQRQRIALARALIVEPRLVVLDEALSALDVTLRAQILDLLAELSATLGIAYLFISHDLGTVRTIADRVLIMRAGRIVEEGSVEAVFNRPQHPHTAALIAATPRLPEIARL